ncbi:hypothetical protein [Streptomyces sp. NPDC004682]
MPSADRFLSVRRDPHSGEVVARGGDPEAHSVLQRAGFVSVVRGHETYHRSPTGLDADDEVFLATKAVERLRSAGYHVDCDEDFGPGACPPRYLPMGASVTHIAERIRAATNTQEAAEALTELTAAPDGVLVALRQVLIATAEFLDGLSDAVSPYTARRLRFMADEHLHVLHRDFSRIRTDLILLRAPHPGRSTCAEEVPASQRERSAVGALAPPQRPLPIPPPQGAAGPHR